MYEYERPQPMLRLVREQVALTQRELGERAGVAQSVIARLERATDANPSVKTVAAVAAAAGFRLKVLLEPIEPPDPVIEAYKRDVDRTLLRENLRRSVEERVRSLGEWQASLAVLEGATRRARAARASAAPGR
ncbi:MAG: helix-turn-helix transcriptional regulator [Gemmatimonadetes bacterium]|nr:helix-turn-helix transcriptional regulator [Gemmatimonadota bacterium]